MGGLPPFNDFDNERNPQRYSAEVSAGYRKNKWDLSTSINYLRNDISGRREGEVYTIINNVRTDFPSNGERSFERYNYGFRFAAGYELNEKSNLTGGFYYGKRFQIRDANLFYNNKRSSLPSGNEISTFDYYNPNRQQKEGTFTLANLAYEHKFSKTSSIVFTGLYERAALSGLTTNLNIPTPFSTDTLQYTRNPSTNPLDAFRLKADYKNGGISAGYQFRYDVQDGNFLYLTQIPGTNDFEVDDEFTSAVKAINIIHAAYVQYEGKKDKLTYTGGLRMETTDRDLSFSKDNETRTLNLVNLFPNAQVRYSLANQWNIKTGFSRRIRRTNNFELNPFPEREHSETLEQGDPDLLPELIGTFELGVEHTYKKGNFFATPYFQQVKNPIQRTNKVYTDTILNRVFTNGEKATQIGMEIGNTHSFTKWWQSIAGFNIYYYKIFGNLFDNSIQAENQAWAFTLNLTQSFSFGKNWSGQLAVNYLSDRPTLQGEDSYFLNPSASLKKVSNDKRWSFQLLCQSADWGWGTSNKQRITTSGSDFFTTTNYIYEVNMIQFSVGFSLQKQNRKIVLPVSEIGEKEF
jgi:outer membrane receptor protein involved in Fe transport